ncbi:MAG: DUF4198 domain-containing protein [Rhodobacteraceae bacterium]|nr:MAG: DUF4198 domain-containing protein [Paracoccaceae bacterium]
MQLCARWGPTSSGEGVSTLILQRKQAFQRAVCIGMHPPIGALDGWRTGRMTKGEVCHTRLEIPMKPTRNRLSAFASALSLGLLAGSASAHDLWVNAMSAGNDGHGSEAALLSDVVTSVGWGHRPMPLSEFLPGARISAYRVITPAGDVLDLPFDADVNASVSYDLGDATGISLQAGDALMRRIVLHEDAEQGSWRVHLANPARVFTTWIDADGNRRSAARFVDEIETPQQIISTAVSVRDATAWWRHGAWQFPEPAGLTFEMLPLTNPTSLRAGEALEVQLYRNGAALEAGQLALFTAFGESGAEAAITETGAGLASISLPQPGAWVLRATLDVPLAEAGPDYAEFDGRVDAIRFITTLAVSVRPKD